MKIKKKYVAQNFTAPPKQLSSTQGPTWKSRLGPLGHQPEQWGLGVGRGSWPLTHTLQVFEALHMGPAQRHPWQSRPPSTQAWVAWNSPHIPSHAFPRGLPLPQTAAPWRVWTAAPRLPQAPSAQPPAPPAVPGMPQAPQQLQTCTRHLGFTFNSCRESSSQSVRSREARPQEVICVPGPTHTKPLALRAGAGGGPGPAKPGRLPPCNTQVFGLFCAPQ